MSEMSIRWFVLTADVSLKVVWLAAVGGLAIAALRIRNSNVRHAVWVGVLGGMLAMPVLDAVLPGLAIPVPRPWASLIPREEAMPQRIAVAHLESTAPVAPVEPPVDAASRFDPPEQHLDPIPVRHASAPTVKVRDATAGRPNVSAEVPAAKRTRSNEQTQIAALQTQEPTSREPDRVASLGPSRIDWTLLAAAVWASGASILLLRLLLGHTAMRGLVRRARVISLPSPHRAGAQGDGPVEIREGAEFIVPVTVGLFRSTVFLPTAWKTWPQDKLADVLAHERAHARRRDCLTAFAADFCVALYWFHPLAWRLRKRLAILAEAACDDAAISSTGNRTAYARHLLEIVSVLSGRSGRLATPGAAMARESNIESRINSILDFNRPLSGRMTPAVRLSIAMLLIPLICLSAALRPSVASEQPAAADRRGSDAQITDRAVNSTSDALAFADPAPTKEKTADSARQAAVASAESGDEQTLTATGLVLHEDGSPAVGATVSVVGESEQQSPTVRAEQDGRFRLSHPFTSRSYLLAQSADRRHQAVFLVVPATARVTLQRAIELKLSPARKQQVLLTANGEPVAGARVVVIGRYTVEERSGPDGQATVWLPAGEKINRILAWDPQLGTAARSFGRSLESAPPFESAPPTGPVELNLGTQLARMFRVVDPTGKPIPGFRLSFDWPEWWGNTWVWKSTTWFETDAHGDLIVPFTAERPRPDRSWMITSEQEVPSKGNRVTKLHVAPLRPSTGRLIMPSQETAEGILVSTSGFGRGTPGGTPRVRARRDGTFTFWVHSGDCHLFNVNDAKWASDGWSGTVLTSDDAQPAAIALNVVHGIPLTVKVTKGPKSEPCPNIDIYGERHQAVLWVDPKSARHTWDGRIPFELVTDAKGVAQLAVPPQSTKLHWCELDCRIGAWPAWQSTDSKSKGPVTVTFHRPWLENRTLFGQMRYAGVVRPATPTTSVRAWTDDGTPLPVELYPEGWFAIAGNPEHAFIYIKDSQKGLNGGRAGELQPTGVYSGTVVDEGGKPVARCRVKLVDDPQGTGSSPRGIVLDEVDCDDQGRFQFATAPTLITVSPVVEKLGANHVEQPLRTVFRDLGLAPAQAYRDDRIVVLSQDGKSAVGAEKAPHKSAAERLPDLLRDARLLHMKVLVVAEGDATASVQEASRKLLDERESPEILRYLPLVIPAAELRAQTPLFARFNARPPAGGENLLLAVDANGRGAREWVLRAEEGPSSVQSGRAFLKDQSPAPRDARQLFAAALAEAKASRREVWVIACGPRSEPCFQLIRWIDDQRQPLEFDYVFLPLLVGCDEHVDQVLPSLRHPPSETSLPWFAIVGADGLTPVTSDGPRGNIGFPETGAAKRYLRQMIDRTAGTMTAAEIDHVIQSLGR
jgi:beta-lactamase regulating signal transducer with metallopeptidase domain